VRQTTACATSDTDCAAALVGHVCQWPPFAHPTCLLLLPGRRCCRSWMRAGRGCASAPSSAWPRWRRRCSPNRWTTCATRVRGLRRAGWKETAGCGQAALRQGRKQLWWQAGCLAGQGSCRAWSVCGQGDCPAVALYCMRAPRAQRNCHALMPISRAPAVFTRLEGKGLKPDTARTYIQAVGGIRCVPAGQ